MKYNIQYFLLLLIFSSLCFAKDAVSVQLKWKHQFQFAGFYAAIEKGYYKEFDLEVQLKELNSNSPIEDVLNGISDFGVDDTVIYHSYLLGKPLTALMAIYQHSPNILLGIKGYQNKHKNAIVEIPFYSQSRQNIQAMIKKIDKEFIIKNPTWALDDLIKHKTDYISAYISNEPYLLKQKGYEPLVLNPRDYGIDFYGDMVYTSNKFLKSNPKLVQRFYNATYQGWIYAFNHIEEIVDLILKKYNTQNKTKEALLYEANELFKLADLDNFGKIDTNRIDALKTIHLIYNQEITNTVNTLEPFIYQWNGSTIKPNLSIEEIKYLQNTIFNVHLNEWRPFRIYDTSSKQFSGLAIDYFNAISKSIDLNYKTIYHETFTQRIQSSKNDSLALGIFTTNRSNKEVNAYTIPYASYPIALVTKIDKKFTIDFDELEGKTLAVGKNYSAYKCLSQYYPKIKFIFTKDTPQAISLVANKKVYGAIDLLPVMQYELHNYSYTDLKISGISKETLDIAISVHKDNKKLIPILNKAIQNLSTHEKKRIENKWYNQNIYNYTSYAWLWYVVGVFTILIIVIQARYIKSMKMLQDQEIQNKKREKEQQELFMRQSRFAQMGEMIAIIAHQWRQPLNSLNMWVSNLILDVQTNSDEKEILKSKAKIQNITRQLSQTITDFENFYKVDKEKKQFNLYQSIQDTLKIIEDKIENNYIQLRLDIDRSLQITSYQNELSQTLIAIINNAIDQHRNNKQNSGLPYIQISARQSDELVTLSICDNAGGIDETIIEKIFDPYFSTKSLNGTGLGLYMSKLIIEKSIKGSIKAYNHQDGACFKIKLPINKNSNNLS